MNQLFVRVVLLCSVVACSLYFISTSKWNKKIRILPLPLNRTAATTKSDGVLDVTPVNGVYDVLVNGYGSAKNLPSLTDIETQLNECNQQTGLLDLEINTLQTQLAEKKQQTFISCQHRLKNRLTFYKKLYKGINNAEMSDREVLELERKIGLENRIE
jgi:hypothetical protein